MLPTAVAEFEEVVKDDPVGLLRRRQLRAVAGVSLRVVPGEVFGLLGPNRAGKTTLLKLLLGLCRPSSGRVIRLGRPVTDRNTLARVGYVHENQAFPRYWTARGLLHYYGAMTLLKEATVKERVPALLERVGLQDRSDEPIAQFSKGMIQRLGLAQALLNDPDLLVLDEPAEGLDLEGRQIVREVCADLKSRGRTVLLISHVLAEVERLCDRVAVLVKGRVVLQGAVADLLRDPATGGPRSLEAALEPLYEKTLQ